MKVFVDANILISVLLMEYPVYPFSARIISLAGTKGFQICTSPICLAIAFYFAEKRYGASSARYRIHVLSAQLEITTTSESTVFATFKEKAILDLEDGLEYFSAVEADCTCIVTEDKEDFHFSKLEILSAEEFVTKYVLVRRF